MFLLALTTAIAGVFFGAAIYVNLVEHPARVACGTEMAVREFGHMYRRAAIMQGSLSALGCLLGLFAAWQLGEWHVGVNAVLLGLPIPVTLLIIAPVNRQLLDPGLDAGRAEQLLARWIRLHWIRTVLGGLAFLLLLCRLIVHRAA